MRSYFIRLVVAAATAAALLVYPWAGLAAQQITVQIRPLGERNEHGTATFTQQGANVLVRVRVSGTPDAMQLVHIHAGPCSRPGRMTVFMLNPIVHGRSNSTLENVRLSFFKKHPYTLGLHTVRAHVSIHAACGGPIGR